MLSIGFHTLGCKLNFAESSHLLRQFISDGFEEKSFHDRCDVYVINTCTVTSIAEKKCRNAIRQAHKLNPNAIIAVIGCFSQVNADEIKNIEGVNIILGNDDKNQLLNKVKQYIYEHPKDRNIIDNEVVDISDLYSFSPSISFDDRTRGFLKIQDGCDYFCSYCEIPFARGRSRSCTIKQVVEYAKILQQRGKKEIILTGVNIGDFGKRNKETFFDLIQQLDKQTQVPRYRISSIEPDLLTKDIIDFCANSQSFMPHFHIPLQAGSNKILKLMNRHYTREDFANKVNYIQSVMPNAFIACDVMTGFNSETEVDFQDSYDFLQSLPISFIHVFTYSERPSTKAYKIANKVPINERRQRSKVLQQLSLNKKRQFYNKHIGYDTTILWEENSKNGKMFGFTNNYIRCCCQYDVKLANNITEHKLNNLSDSEDLFLL